MIKAEKEFVMHLHSLEDTADLALRLSKILDRGDVLLFTGVIGAGKTTFIQSLANNLGIRERVTSPTFVIHMLRDSGRIPLSHVDLYRLETDEEVENIGFEEYYDSAVTVIEWADRYSNFAPPYLHLHFEYGTGESERRVTISANGGDWERRLEALFADK